jgi:Tfp pilus assembly PilM family ATPase
MRRCRSPIAIDFGEHSVTALQLDSRAGRVRVRAARRERLPPAVAGGAPHDRWLRAANVALRRTGFTGREATVALGLADVATPHVRIPVESLDQAGDRIAAHLQAHTATADGASITPLPVADLYDQGERKREYLCCVAGNAAIAARIALVEQLGLVATAIELAPLAQLRPLLRNAPDASFVHVDFGANETRVCIVRSGEPVLVRAVRVGGEQLRAAVEARLGLELAVLDDLGSANAIAPAVVADAVGNALAEPLEPVVRRIADGLRYCGSLFGGRAATELRATGAAAHLPGVLPWLGRRLGISSTVAEPFAGIDAGVLSAYGAVHRSHFTTALGLALGSLAA